MQSLSDWCREDFGIACGARGHHFGLVDKVLDELAQAGSPQAREVAPAWRPRIDQLRYDAYGLADEAEATKDEHHRIDERLAVKVAITEALGSVTRALLTARSGRGLGSTTRRSCARAQCYSCSCRA